MNMVMTKRSTIGADSAVTRVEEEIVVIKGGRARWGSGQKWALAHGLVSFEGKGCREWEGKGHGGGCSTIEMP